MNWLMIFNTVFSYCWLIAVLWLGWRVYRSGLERTQHVAQMQRMLTEVMQANANAATIAAESARLSVETVHNLVATLTKDAIP